MKLFNRYDKRMFNCFSGYYDVDTSILRETMRVVTPAVEDRADLGTYIMTECYGYPIYKLEKYVSGGRYTVYSLSQLRPMPV